MPYNTNNSLPNASVAATAEYIYKINLQFF